MLTKGIITLWTPLQKRCHLTVKERSKGETALSPELCLDPLDTESPASRLCTCVRGRTGPLPCSSSRPLLALGPWMAGPRLGGLACLPVGTAPPPLRASLPPPATGQQGTACFETATAPGKGCTGGQGSSLGEGTPRGLERRQLSSRVSIGGRSELLPVGGGGGQGRTRG